MGKDTFLRGRTCAKLSQIFCIRSNKWFGVAGACMESGRDMISKGHTMQKKQNSLHS